MNKAILNRIDQRLRAVGKTATAASREAGLGLDAIRDIRRKPTILPRLDTLAALAGPLATTPEWLAFGRGAADPSLEDGAFQSVPLVSWVAASNFSEAGAVVVEGDESWQRIRVGDLPEGQYIALLVEGTSMNRIAVHHSHIIVRLSDKNLVDRGFYVMASDEGATFKRYRNLEGPPRLEPYSTFEGHPTLYPQGEVRVIGRVARVLTDLYQPSVAKNAY